MEVVASPYTTEATGIAELSTFDPFDPGLDMVVLKNKNLLAVTIFLAEFRPCHFNKSVN